MVRRNLKFKNFKKLIDNKIFISIFIIIILLFFHYFAMKILGYILYKKFTKLKGTQYWNNKIKTIHFNKCKSCTKKRVLYFIHGYGGAPDQILLNANVYLKKYKNYNVILKCANHKILSDV